jgi:hypothetical protein
MGPDDSRQDRDETVTEDVGLSEDDLPATEDDTARGGDTGSGEQNP